jgi:hypothetical protein
MTVVEGEPSLIVTTIYLLTQLSMMTQSHMLCSKLET